VGLGIRGVDNHPSWGDNINDNINDDVKDNVNDILSWTVRID